MDIFSEVQQKTAVYDLLDMTDTQAAHLLSNVAGHILDEGKLQTMFKFQTNDGVERRAMLVDLLLCVAVKLDEEATNEIMERGRDNLDPAISLTTGIAESVNSRNFH